MDGTGLKEVRLSLFCHDLPSRPDPAIGTVLVTGASGYIGGRLVPELAARGYRVRVMVRTGSPEYARRWPGAEIVVADALDAASLGAALSGVAVAYYLIHSMLLGPGDFAAADIRAASNFRRAAEAGRVKRIVYLGGLGDVHAHLSRHLRSRVEVAEELGRGAVPVTILRAAIIIGSGSASYEIIKHLVARLPVIPVPQAARHRCQPVAVRDVVKYLVGVLETPETSGRSFDIGGPDAITYEAMMKTVADVLQKRRLFVPIRGVLGIRTYAHLASLITPVPGQITRCLMEGLRNDVVCEGGAIRQILPFAPIPYREAVVRALSREEQDRVHTRWSDAYPPAHDLAMKLAELAGGPRFSARYSIETDKPSARLFRSMCRIGGRDGWFHYNWMWRMRGMVDRLLMGVGTSRGRRHLGPLAVHDVVDFWRVEAVEEDRRLLLRAEMKLPGRAWLEFSIEEPRATGPGRRNLAVAAYYDTSSAGGRAYWYVFLPLHRLIFKDLIKAIERRS
ncbi:MAG: SDR family oxidoreductase [bacterium]